MARHGAASVPVSSRGPEPEPADRDAAPDPALTAHYHQLLVWQDFGGNQCATMKLPLHHAVPEGGAIDVKITRVPAGEGRVGALAWSKALARELDLGVR